MLIGGIRKLYTVRQGCLVPFPWLEDFLFHLDDIFTRLKVVSRKKTRGKITADIVNMSGIFKPHRECSQPIRTVLIEGEPGMGKTTYCAKLAYDWATGKLCTTGKPCTPEQQEEKDCFPRFELVLLLKCRDMKSDLWKTIDDQLLPEDVEDHVKKQFFDFIRQNQTDVLLILDGLDEVAASKLPIVSKIIEGNELRECRLVATARQKAGISARKHCDTLLEITGFTKEDATKLISKYFPDSEDTATKLLLELARDDNLKDMATNPLNVALLCLNFEENASSFPESRSILYLNITRCILQRYKKKNGSPETSKDPIDEYGAHLKHLGRIALTGLQEEKLDFAESELKSHADESPAFELLSVHTGRTSRRYSFQHKSFQEWFAAFFLSCQLIEKKIIPKSVVDDREYAHELNEVLPYTCGLLAARCKENAVTLIKCMMKKVNQGDSDGWLTVVLECTRECKQKDSSFQETLARELGSLLKLQTLEVHDGKLSAANVVVLADVLKSNKTVTELNLCNSNIDDASAASLAGELRSITTLKVLKLSGNDIGDAGAVDLMSALKFNKTLTELHFSGNCIGEAGAKGVADALESNKTLTELDLSSNEIGDAGATALADGLKFNTKLIVLYLSANGISNGARGLADGLKSNTTLSTLDLSRNAIGNGGAAVLANLLKSATTLSVWNLSRNGIGDAGAASLADALKSNTTPRELNLSENSIGVGGIAGVADGLKSNTTLSVLNLSRNRVGDDGAAELADGLKSNTRLTVLNLSGNKIGDAGAANLADGLKFNTKLTVLHLSGNGIGNDGAACLAGALESNKTLTTLYLCDNGICDAGAVGLADALISNTTLTRLWLSGNNIGNNGLAGLAGTLKSNKTLTVDLFSP